MPFIEMNERVRLADPKEMPRKPGELCYVLYKGMVEAWKQNPSWTLWHTMFATGLGLNDMQAAKMLALMVFFIEHVMPYEQLKKLENGDIK